MGSARFFPPGTRHGQHLFREDLVSFGRSVLAESGRLAAVAPAGQGKSQFAAQVAALEPAIWLSCDAADADPSVLATDLLLAAATALSGWKDQGLRTRAQRAELFLKGTASFVRAFYTSLSRHGQNLLLVLDDLHLAARPACQPLLEALARERPPGIRLLWLSRSLPDALAAGLHAGDFPRISIDRLAMNQPEIRRLYNAVYGIPISPETAEHLHRVTHGWTMGVVSARRRLGNDTRLEATEFLDADLRRFFHDTFLGRLTGIRRNFVICLSALEHIPISMILELAPDEDFPSLLKTLGEEGLFIQKSDRETYTFHHLIRDFLKEMECLGEERHLRTDILKRMASWHEERGLFPEALTCFAAAGDAKGADILVDIHFPELITLREDARIACCLMAFEAPENHPGLALSLAFFTMAESNPDKTANLLHAAAKGFSNKKNIIGELRAILLMIRRRLFGDILYEDPEILFNRMKNLLQHTNLHLSQADELLVALGWGQFAILHAFSRKMVREKVVPVLSKGIPPSLVSIQAELIAILCHGEAMTGRHRMALEISEKGYPLLSNPDISTWSHFYLRMARANTLGLCGMEAAFFKERSRILALPPPLLDRTFAGPFLRIWEISFLIRKGLYREAEDLAGAKLQDPQVTALASLQGEFLHYRAYALALLGERSAAMEMAVASEAAQEKGGNVFFRLVNLLVTGLVFALCGRFEEAEKKTDQVLTQQQVDDEIGLREGAFWVRAFTMMQSGKQDKACRDLEEALTLSKIRNAPHFLFAPSWMPPLLELAVGQGISRLRAETLGKELFGLTFDVKGEAFPLMEVRLLGEFSLICGNFSIRAAELSPLHRNLLGLLILSPGHSMAVSGIRERLWPHVMPESARTSMDTTLLRLRRILVEKLGKAAAGCLVLSNGVLSLSPIRVDAFAYLDLVAKADAAKETGSPWMAEAHLAEATALDGGDYSGDLLDLEEATTLANLIREARKRVEG